MASSSQFPPPNETEVIDISSDSDADVYYESDSDGTDDYPYGWIRSNDPRFVGKEVREGEIPFGPGFVKPITKSQAVKGQALVSIFSYNHGFITSFMNFHPYYLVKILLNFFLNHAIFITSCRRSLHGLQKGGLIGNMRRSFLYMSM